jgi:hypothetical protein
MMPKADVLDLSSSDTGALLDSLFMSPACGYLVSRPHTSSDCDSFEYWLESNDMFVSVYVALSAQMLQASTHLWLVDCMMLKNLVAATRPLRSFTLRWPQRRKLEGGTLRRAMLHGKGLKSEC